MTTHHRSQSVADAQADVGVKLNALQREHGLTDVEMLQAVTTWQGRMLRYRLLQAERHPDDPGKGSDEE